MAIIFFLFMKWEACGTFVLGLSSHRQECCPEWPHLTLKLALLWTRGWTREFKRSLLPHLFEFFIFIVVVVGCGGVVAVVIIIFPLDVYKNTDWDIASNSPAGSFCILGLSSPYLIHVFSFQFREQVRVQWTLHSTKLPVLSSVVSLQLQVCGTFFFFFFPKEAEIQLWINYYWV